MKFIPSRSWLFLLTLGLPLSLQVPAWADVAPPPFTSLQPVRAIGLRSMAYFARWHLGERPNPVNFCLRSVKTTGFSWVTAGVPVTYSFSIADCPQGAAFVTLIGGSTPVVLANNQLASNVISMRVERLVDGTALATLRFKVNTTNTDAPIIASLAVSEPLGNWSLTMDGTNASMKAPDGREQTATIPSAALSQFVDPMSVYFGGGERDPYGSMDLTLSRLSICGVPGPLDETFEANELDSSCWELFSDGRCSGIIVPKEAGFWLASPALYYSSGYTLQTSTSLQPSSWSDYPIPTNALPYGRYVNMVPIPTDTNAARFFRTIGPR